jgi:hypothetical protein
MKKNTLFFTSLLLITSVGFAMQEEGRPLFACNMPKNDGSANDDVYVFGKKEKFDRYFCDLKDTESCDDTNPQNTAVKWPIFVQVYIQASKITDSNRAAAFQQLCTKLRSHEINIDTEKIYMTEKDLKHRLLSCIPTGQQFSLINNKKVELILVSYETKQDSVYNAPLRDKIKELEDKQAKLKDNLSDGWVIRGRKGVPLKLSGQELETVMYNFESDATHHAAIIKEFEEFVTIR